MARANDDGECCEGCEICAYRGLVSPDWAVRLLDRWRVQTATSCGLLCVVGILLFAFLPGDAWYWWVIRLPLVTMILFSAAGMMLCIWAWGRESEKRKMRRYRERLAQAADRLAEEAERGRLDK